MKQKKVRNCVDPHRLRWHMKRKCLTARALSKALKEVGEKLSARQIERARSLEGDGVGAAAARILADYFEDEEIIAPEVRLTEEIREPLKGETEAEMHKQQADRTDHLDEEMLAPEVRRAAETSHSSTETRLAQALQIDISQLRGTGTTTKDGALETHRRALHEEVTPEHPPPGQQRETQRDAEAKYTAVGTDPRPERKEVETAAQRATDAERAQEVETTAPQAAEIRTGWVEQYARFRKSFGRRIAFAVLASSIVTAAVVIGASSPDLTEARIALAEQEDHLRVLSSQLQAMKQNQERLQAQLQAIDDRELRLLHAEVMTAFSSGPTLPAKPWKPWSQVDGLDGLMPISTGAFPELSQRCTKDLLAGRGFERCEALIPQSS